MTPWLIKTFVKDSEKTTDPLVRTNYGKLAGFVGILCNVFLFGGKMLAGVISGSIAIMADAINNLSDAASNIVTLLGFKLAAKKPDKKHPYGYARYEYLAGLTVSVIILAIGLSLGKDSIMKIIEPELMKFSWLSVGILVASILVKLWMSVFNKDVGERIDSETLRATAADSRNDVLTTGAVLISMFITYFTQWEVVDGIMGLGVALFIIYSGIGLIRDTLSPILGESPDPTLVSRIEKKVKENPKILGMHDLIVHDYGPGHQFASFHLEMPAEFDVMKSHDIIDNLEDYFLKNEHINVSIHFDPIVTNDERLFELRRFLTSEIAKIHPELSIHDLRMVPGQTHTNVLFDLVFPPDYHNNPDEIVEQVNELVKSQDSLFVPKIKVEQSYIGDKE